MSNQRQNANTSRDEDLLLQDFSRNVTSKSSALFIGNAAVVSAIPLWLFWRIHQMDLTSYFIYFIIGTAASTYALNVAYRNMKFILRHKIAQKREEAINKEISKLLPNEKGASNKKERDDQVLRRTNEVADFEATTFSIFYNNAFYLICLIVLSFFVFKNFAPTVNYLFSVALSTAVVFLFSTGEK